MRDYNYNKIYDKLLTSEIVSLLTKIHEFKGQQNLFIEAKSDVLTQLVDIAKIQSTEASNRIEGIFTSEERLKKIVRDKTHPQTRSEREIAGYRDVLVTIHESHDFIPLKSAMILQLHRDLYKYSGMGFGGAYKTSNNVISERDVNGNKFIRFQPVEAWETTPSIEAACTAFDEALKNNEQDPLLLIPIFILDFLCIHPFNDGNGRMSRLLTLLLLYRAGYIVGKYISIEKLIEQSKETYYEVLQQSSCDWHEEANDYLPFVRYTLGIIVAAYRDFSSRVELLALSNLSKPERIKEYLKNTFGKITKSDIVARYPDISAITVQRTLIELQKANLVTKHGGGRATAYSWNREND